MRAKAGGSWRAQADVRDAEAMDAVVAEGLREFGRLDIVIANAGIIRVTDSEDRRGVVPRHRRRQPRRRMEHSRRGHSGSDRRWARRIHRADEFHAGNQGFGHRTAGLQAYAASKRGLVALMQGWASQLAPQSIRVNTIHPSGVATDMIINEATMALAAANDPWLATQQNALPIALLQPEEIAGAVAWLVSDAGQVHHRHLVAARRRVHRCVERLVRTGPRLTTRRRGSRVAVTLEVP